MTAITVRDAGVFLAGAAAALAGVAGVFFFRFWRRSGDRFFLMFAAAMALIAVNRIGIVFAGPSADRLVVSIAIRTGGHLMILCAIVFKNLPGGRRG